MKKIVVGKDENNYAKIPTRINGIYHYKSLAERLQIKYPKRWKENRNIKRKREGFSVPPYCPSYAICSSESTEGTLAL